MHDHLATYYARRAAEYDDIYRVPERQADIQHLAGKLAELLGGRNVLEVACGTGFWTERFGPATQRVLAADLNEEVLDIARARVAAQPQIIVQKADAMSLAGIPRDFNAAFAGFWWSHISKPAIQPFLDVLRGKLSPGARIVFADNRFVPGSSTAISRTDADGNTYQLRRLKDGQQFEILKNFLTADEFRAAVRPHARSVEFHESTYYWCGWYELA